MSMLRRSLSSVSCLPRTIDILRQTCSREQKEIELRLRSASLLSPDKNLEDFLQTNKLADPSETVFDVLSLAAQFLAQSGEKFYGSFGVAEHRNSFLKHACLFEIIFGNPILTNAGRRADKSVSACSIPSI